MDLLGDNLIYVIGALAFVVIAAVGLVFTADSGAEKAAKRAKQLGADGGTGLTRKANKNDPNAMRRKQTQQMLNKLREEDKVRRQSLMANNIEDKLRQAGLEMAPPVFWTISAVLAGTFGLLFFMTGASGPPPIMEYELQAIIGPEASRIATLAAAMIGGGIGFPRWVLGMMAKNRNKKMMNQFADGMDVIVRGVKSGLPLTECLRIIAAESPAPLGPEFKQLTDNVQMGMTMDRALQTFYKRVPLSEVNFFVIVLSIQAKAGGNLSEALGNLSAVIRSRKMMREKIKALSSEAKASAMIIGCLPFAVAFMVYTTTPDYIIELFIKPMGHMILFMAFCLMATGITVMRKMINFDI
ncbi:MAG: type II secretion system F family protein [Henriciella sp.]|nr:type II secretion system F family protein [Henriciella sp.]